MPRPATGLQPGRQRACHGGRRKKDLMAGKTPAPGVGVLAAPACAPVSARRARPPPPPPPPPPPHTHARPGGRPAGHGTRPTPLHPALSPTHLDARHGGCRSRRVRGGRGVRGPGVAPSEIGARSLSPRGLVDAKMRRGHYPISFFLLRLVSSGVHTDAPPCPRVLQQSPESLTDLTPCPPLPPRPQVRPKKKGMVG